MPRHKLLGLVLTISLVLIPLAAGAAATQARSLAQSASQGEQIFQAKCASCHTIGKGVLVGPDLLGVTERQDVEWLREFIQNPDQVIASGDPTATQLLQEFNNLPMPNLGLSDQEVGDLIAFLQSQSSSAQTTDEATSPPSRAEGGAASKPQLSGDIARGQALFTGSAKLANGGPACMACHHVTGIGVWGGGVLGPDLTFVANRYSESGLTSVLQTLPFKVMQDVYNGKPLTPQEQADLAAYFIQQGSQTQSEQALATPVFMGFGGVIGVLLFLVMYFFWRGQRHGMATRIRRRS